jgi:hypothetical protein
MTGEKRNARNAEGRSRGIIRRTAVHLDSLRKKKQENLMINCVPVGTGRGQQQDSSTKHYLFSKLSQHAKKFYDSPREFRNSQPWQIDDLTQSKRTYIAQPKKYYSDLVARSPVTYRHFLLMVYGQVLIRTP